MTICKINMTNCFCTEPTVSRTVRKEGPNKGRSFNVCKKEQEACKWFSWADADGPNCGCKLLSVQRECKKDNENRGRKFNVCPRPMKDAKRCNFFEWAAV